MEIVALIVVCILPILTMVSIYNLLVADDRRFWNNNDDEEN